MFRSQMRFQRNPQKYINALEIKPVDVRCNCQDWYLFGDENELGQRPENLVPFRVSFKISEGHPSHFYVGIIPDENNDTAHVSQRLFEKCLTLLQT